MLAELEPKLPSELPRVEGLRTISSWFSQDQPIENFGPFASKSGAKLKVRFAFRREDFDPAVLATDIDDPRLIGYRSYELVDIKEGAIGGGEFHRLRRELLVCTKGQVAVVVNDLYSKEKGLILGRGQGVLIPPFILHTYQALQESDLTVVCNTLFDPSDPETHDTYSQEVFSDLQKRIGGI